MGLLRLIALAIWVVSPATAVIAADGGNAGAAAPGWIATLGFSAEVADNGEVSVLPSTVELRRADEPEGFGAPDDVFGFGLLDWHGLEVGPAFDVRHADGSFAVDAGAYAEYWPVENRLRLRLEALHNVGSDAGGHVTLGGDVVAPVHGATASIGPRLTVGDRDYFRTTADSSDEVSGAARFYAGATAALKVPVGERASTTFYDEFQVPLSGAGEQDGNAQNTLGVEVDFSFHVGGS